MAADMRMHTAVDDFVLASVAVLEVVKINEMTAQAIAAGDVATAENLQTYIANNDVRLSQQEVADFNTSLDIVETSVTTYAAFQTVATNDSLKAELESASADIQGSADQAAGMFYDSASQVVGITFAQTTDTQTNFIDASISVSQLVAFDNSSFLQTGANTQFYQQGPTQNPNCLLNTTDLTSCTRRQSYSGPPPNQLLYRDTNNDGVFEVFAVTDANGVIYEFVDGDIVTNPYDGNIIGEFINGSLSCYAGYETYCA
jgi:hypothetical protein